MRKRSNEQTEGPPISKCAKNRSLQGKEEWRELTEEDLERALVLLSRFSLSLRVIWRRIATKEEWKKVKCGACDTKVSKSSELRRHMLCHLSSDPWKCTECELPLRDPISHWKKSHPDRSESVKPDERAKLRPEIASELHDLLFECFPGFESVKELDEEAMERQLRCGSSLEPRKSLSSGAWIEAKRLTDRYKLTQKVILAKVLAAHKGGNFTCGLCKRELRRHTELPSHILTHIHCQPWRCSSCGKPIADISRHWRRYHSDLIKNTPIEQRVQLRPELAKEALELVFQCLPGYDWLRNVNMAEIEMMIKTRAIRCENSNLSQTFVTKTEKMEETTETAQDFIRRFELSRKVIHKEMMNTDGEEDFKCKYCNHRVSWARSFISTHILSHLPSAPWKCLLCDSLIQSPEHHWKSSHREQLKSLKKAQRVTLRPEVAKEAFELLFKCTEGFDWIREMSFIELEKQLGSFGWRQDGENPVVLSPEKLVSKQKIAKRFQDITKAVGNVLKLKAFHQGLHQECSRCGHRFVFGLYEINRTAIIHAMSHMSKKSFRCDQCGELTNSMEVHYKFSHPNTNINDHGEILVRPEVADEAIENIFLCFPDLKWLLESSDQRIAELGKENFLVYNDSLIEEDEPGTSEEMPNRFNKLISSVVNQWRNQVGPYPAEVYCDFCNRGITRPRTKNLSQFIWDHVLGHLNRKCFRCSECLVLVSNLHSHFYNLHKDLGKRSKESCRTIREEVAPQAIEILFKCYPKFRWLLEKEEDSIDFADNSLDYKFSYVKKELEEMRSESIRHYYLVEATINQLISNHGSEAIFSCGKCKPGKFRIMRLRHELWSHLMNHMEVKPFSCRICHRTSTNLHSHFLDHHREENISYAEQRIVRPEISDAAIRNLFECFPEYEHLRKCSQDELNQLAWHQNFQHIDSSKNIASTKER